MRSMLLIAALLCANANAYAGYFVTGPVEGSVCKGFVIESCSFKIIAAVENSNNGLSEVARYFKEVSEYKSSTGQCFIRLKSKSGGVFATGADALRLPNFYEKVGGEYKKISPEYLTFPCRPE